jgi:glyoxylase-like metal-dependent hydrolase (beta-lactamase superfamily II)
MFVRLVDRQRRRLVNSAEAAVLDGADSERQVTEWDEADRAWYRELSAAGLLVSDSPEDGVELDVVGESHYHADLAGLMVALRNDFEATEVTTAARLVREPGNPYDRNAVRVEIHGKLVGYLSRDEAADIQPRLKKTERRTRPTYVLARLGGGRVDHGVVGPIGVTLENLPEDVLD